MKLENKKSLISRTLNVGKGRIVLNRERLSEVKEAITKQDVKDLVASGAILVRPEKGRKKVERRKNRRRAGSVKKKVKNSKRTYITITRKLRTYISSSRDKGKISRERYLTLRKEIRNRSFKSLAHLKEKIQEASQ